MNDPVLAKTVEAVNKAELAEQSKRPVMPQVDMKELEKNLQIIPSDSATLGELVQGLHDLQTRHRKEIDEHLTRIVSKINSIKSNII
jgi:hypothetical protein